MQDVHVKLHPRLPWQKQPSTKNKALFTSKLDLNLRKKLVKCYIWSIALYGRICRIIFNTLFIVEFRFVLKPGLRIIP
jgi:hypothetical protein